MSEISTASPRRKTLTMAITALLTEMGFEAAEKVALETLSEMAQSFLTECGRSSRAFCEHAGRVEPLVGDVTMAVMDMGISMEGLEVHAKRNNRLVLPALSIGSQPKQLPILQAGMKLQHPAQIPSHLPSFPDPHAYIRTPTHKQPVTEYEALREKAAAHKRDVERALTRFVAKTGDTHSLFQTDDTNLFPLIACKPHPRPYLEALLPQDQIFDADEEELEQDQPSPGRKQNNKRSESPTTNSQLGERKRRKSSQSPPSSPTSPDSPSQNKNESLESPSQPQNNRANESTTSINDADMIIDNPYLRPVKLPRKNKVGTYM